MPTVWETSPGQAGIPVLQPLGQSGPGVGMLLSPGLLLGLDLPDDALHPGEEVSGHAEEAEFVCRVHQLGAAPGTGVEQCLPRGRHFLLLVLDDVCLLPSIRRLQAGGHVLELLYL